jgi:hypothetical protein
MELISHIANATFSSLELQTKQSTNQKCLKITAFKQKTFQIVKERTMREASRDHSNSQWTKPTWARVIARIVCRHKAGGIRRSCASQSHLRCAMVNAMVEPAGIEPATFWLQTRRSPS